MAVCFRWYLRMLKVHPWKTQVFTAGSMMTAGDLICQTILEKKKFKEIEGSRMIRFGVLGTCFVGPVLHRWYMQLEKIFGVSGSTVGLKKMLLDQFVFAPCFIAGFLSVSGIIQWQAFDSILDTLKKDYFAIVKANYAIWPAAQLITFYVIPLQFRILFVSTIALGWNTYLAWKINKVENKI